MIAVSELAARAISANSRTFLSRFLHNGAEISGDVRSVTINKGSCGGSVFAPGTVFSSYIDVVIDNCPEALSGKELTYQIGVVIDENTTEWYDIGQYTVHKPSTNVYTTSFTALGRISAKMGMLYQSELVFPATIQSVLDEISANTGIEIDASAFDTSGVIEKEISGYMYREVLAIIAGLFFGYATEDANGRVVFTSYKNANIIETDGDRTSVLPNFADHDTEIKGVKVSAGDISTIDKDTGNEVYKEQIFLTGSPNAVAENEHMTQALFDANVGNIVGYTYRPATVSISLGDFRIEPFDCLQVTDSLGVVRTVPCMSVVHRFDGGLITDITAPDLADSEDSGTAFKGLLTQAVERYQQELISVKTLLAGKISAGEVEATYATIQSLDAVKANVQTLTADNIAINSTLSAHTGAIDALTSDNVTIKENLSANSAKISTLETDNISIKNTLSANSANITNLSGEVADFKAATAENFEAQDAEIEKLIAKDADIEELVAKKANISDLEATTAEINNLLAGKATVTDLNAAVARIGKIESDYITTEELSAEIAEINEAKIDTATVNELLAEKADVTDFNALTATVNSLSAKEAAFETATAENFKAQDAEIEKLIAKDADIEELVAKKANISDLEATTAEINNLLVGKATVTDLNAAVARIGKIESDYITTEEFSAEVAEINEAKIDTATVNELLAEKADVTDFNALTATVNSLSAKEAAFETATAENFKAVNGSIETLQTNALTADSAVIKSLQTDKLSVSEAAATYLTAESAVIKSLQTDKLDASAADLKYATITNLNAAVGRIDILESDYVKTSILAANYLTANQISSEYAKISVLEADYVKASTLTANYVTSEQIASKYLTSESAAVTYANIDFSNIGKAAMEYFYSKSGLIENVTVGDATISGELVGVTIKGDLIEGGTVVADKLVIQGTDGLYYKLNTDGITTEASQTDYNSLNGSVIKAKSITASKISVTDLVAFGATIGGFHITAESIYSGVKSAVGNTTRGIYLDNTGQIAFGDASNYIKYFEDSDGSYKLVISADDILLSTSSLSVESSINAAQKAADDAQSDVDDLAANVSSNYATKSEVTQTASSITSSVQAVETIATTALSQGVEYIVGTQTAATNAWTGKTTSTSLFVGKTIAYKLPYAGTSSAATLNLTLPNGSTTGAKGIRRLTSTVTTHYGAGTVVNMTYDGTYWRVSDYDSNTFDRIRYNQVIKCGTTAIVAANIIVGASGVYKHLKAGTAFDLSYPILYASSDIVANGTGSNNYVSIPFAVKTTQSMTLTAYKPVYIKGTLSGKMFTPASTAPLTQTEPTSADGYFYILLGTAYSTTNMYLLPEHPLFKYDNGGFKSIEQILVETQSRVTQTEESITAVVERTSANESAIAQLQIDADNITLSVKTTNENVTKAQNTADSAASAASNAQDAADAAQADVNALTNRVTTAETNISQNAEQIALRATKTEVTETLGDYYTKEETEAAIVEKSDEITLYVSSSYATKAAINTINNNVTTLHTKVEDAQLAADTAQETADNAVSNATIAQNTANNATTAASNAQTIANNAATDASNAQEVANNAATKAEVAQEVANNAATKANDAQTKAATAVSNAAAAQDTADDAQAAADVATQAANDAQAAADEADIKAGFAQSTATTAKNNAAAAQETADGVKDDLATNYYTKTETEAKIEVSADSIKSTVSETYATKTALNTTNSNVTTAQNTANAAQTAAANAQSDVDKLAENVETNYATKSEVTQTAESIKSEVSSTYQTKAGMSDYSTTEEMNSAIEQKADSITSTVSSTYATKTALSATDTKAANAATAAANAQSEVEALETNVATNYATKSEVTQTANSITSTVEATYQKSVSRGEQLVTNGNGLLGNDTNFSSWNFDGAVANNSPGSFTTTQGNKYSPIATDEFFPVSTNNEYTFSFDAKTLYGLSRMYSMLIFYDADKNMIKAANHMHRTASTTTLAKDLKAGDTVIYLTDVSGWSTSYSYGFYLAVWNYTNSYGYTYPSGTYTRTRITLPKTSADKLDSSCLDTTAKTITLASAYTGATIPAGTSVSQGSDGGNYKYNPLSNKLLTTEWVNYSGKYAGVDYSGTNVNTKFPPATAYAKVGFLWNYNGAADQTWITNVVVTDTTAVSAAQEAADNAQADVDSIKTRVTQTESNITAVASRTTDNETDIAQLQLDAEGLTVSLQTTNANVTTVQNTANSAATAASNAQAEVDNISSAKYLISSYSQPLSTLKGWATEGKDAGSWAVSSTAGVRVGDTVYIRCTNSDTGQYLYIVVAVTSVTSSTVLRGISHGFIDPYATDVANTARTEAAAAAKTATNYLDFSSSGLVVGDMTASTLGKNVLIDSDSVDIRNGTTVLASFRENKIELGKGASNAVIDLLNGLGTISSQIVESGDDAFLAIDALRFYVNSEKISLYADGDSYLNIYPDYMRLLSPQIHLTGDAYVRGDLNFTISDISLSQAEHPKITWPKGAYIGYASDQSDGTFVVASILGTNYASGLAIGGGSGNLLYKGAKVPTLSDVASTTTAGVMSADDKMKLNQTNVAYGVCATEAATAAKTVSLNGNTKWILTVGSIICIEFYYTNTASNPTLNVNGTGAKNIYYGTAQITTSNLSYAGYADRKMMFMYDGTGYWFMGWSYDANTNTQLRVYRQDSSSYNADYPLIASRTKAASLGTVGTESSYESVYGLISDTNANIPTVNPYTGVVKVKSLTINGVDTTRAYTSMIPYGTAVSESADLNTTTYLKVGNYFCGANATAKTLTNCPTNGVAFMMQVYTPLSTTIDNESTGTWVYRLRKLMTYTGDEYVQYCYAGSTAGTWNYGSWIKTINNNDLFVRNAAASARGSVTPVSLAAGVITPLTLDTWVTRNNSNFAFSDGGIKCPYAGNVMVSGNVYFTGGTTNDQVKGVYIQKNGSEVISQWVRNTKGEGSMSSGVAIISVAAGDIIKLCARAEIATSCSASNGSTILNVAYV